MRGTDLREPLRLGRDDRDGIQAGIQVRNQSGDALRAAPLWVPDYLDDTDTIHVCLLWCERSVSLRQHERVVQLVPARHFTVVLIVKSLGVEETRT